jgi:hypothetical protein
MYDASRAAVVSSQTMTKLSTGVYEYTYAVPSGANAGAWESVVTVGVGSSQPQQLTDYFMVTGSPAQVLISSVTGKTPDITANIKITNEGSGDFEYRYEWCVVRDQSAQCNGNANVYYGSASKLIARGQDFVTDVTATVPEAGTYWFKLNVYYGTQSSSATRQFPVEQSGVTPAPPTTSGGTAYAGGPAQVLTVDTLQGRLDSLQTTLNTQSENVAKVLSLLGIMKPQMDSLTQAQPGAKATIQDVQNRLADLQALSQSIRTIVENGSNAPVVQTYMKFHSVVISFVVTNPASTKQTVSFRSFLPAEVKASDVINLDGLSIDYDTSAGMYYVYGNLTLEPKESVNKSVEMKDIWVYDSADLNALATQVSSFTAALKNTQYAAQSTLLANDITQLIAKIETSQKQSYVSPQDHILAYRDNKANYARVMDDFNQLKNLLVQSGASQSLVGKIGGIQTFATWGIILAIVFGFGLLAAIIFAMWRYQVLLAAQMIRTNAQILKRSQMSQI